MKKWQKISLCASMALVSGLTGLSAQSIAAGSFHSFKGVGISAEIPSAGISEFNVFTLYADLADVYAGVQPSPGIKFNYSHNIGLVRINPLSREDFSLFAGSGFSAGWVTDSGRDGYGLCAALSGTFGARAGFPSGIVLTLSLSIETGGFVHDNNSHVESTLYRNGLFHTAFPSIGIYYRIK